MENFESTEHSSSIIALLRNVFLRVKELAAPANIDVPLDSEDVSTDLKDSVSATDKQLLDIKPNTSQGTNTLAPKVV